MILTLILSLIALALVCSSFTPQIRQIVTSKATTGISLASILCNLICTTEHLFFVSYYTFDLPQLSDDERNFLPDNETPWVHSPRIALDWLNFAQISLVWVAWNVLFGLCLYHTPRTRTRRVKKTLFVLLYAAFVALTLLPVVVDRTTSLFCAPDCGGEEAWDIMGLYVGLHEEALLPLFTALPLVIGFMKQRRVILRHIRGRSRIQNQRRGFYTGIYEMDHPSLEYLAENSNLDSTLTLTSEQPGGAPNPDSDANHNSSAERDTDTDLNTNNGLSIRFLRLQTFAFSISAISWCFRANFPWGWYFKHGPATFWLPYMILEEWFRNVGFVAVDEAIYAFLMALLLKEIEVEKKKANRNGSGCGGDGDGDGDGDGNSATEGVQDPERQPLLG